METVPVWIEIAILILSVACQTVGVDKRLWTSACGYNANTPW